MGKSIKHTLLALLITVAWPLQAHHSTANFDRSKTITVTGTATQFVFSNPHSLIEMKVDDSGQTTPYRIFGTSKVVLIRYGWRPDSVKPDDILTVSGYPDKDNPTYLYLTEITFADGSQWFRDDVSE